MGVRNLTITFAAFSLAHGAAAQVVYTESFEGFVQGQALDSVSGNGAQWFAHPNWFISQPSTSGCFADLTNDFVVDGGDLANLLASWSSTNSASDLNGDGVTNGADLAQLLAAFGGCDGRPGGLSIDAAPSADIPLTSGSVFFENAITGVQGTTVSFEVSVFIEPPGHSLRFIPQAFGNAPLSTHFFILAPSDVVRYRVGEFVSAKQVVHGEWVTFTYDLTFDGEGQSSVRVMLEDSETKSMFGPDPVEIFPAGPFGPAINGASLVEAPEPYMVGLDSVNGLDFAVDQDTSAIDSIYIDEITVRVQSP